MNPKQSLGIFLILAVAVGCFSACASTQVESKESMLSEAGFRKLTPSTPAQSAMYNQMAPYKLERNTSKGKALYTYADKQKGVVYIGGDNAYQRYKQMALQKATAEKELEASYSNMLSTEDRVWSVNYD
jgi:hypothetical protein